MVTCCDCVDPVHPPKSIPPKGKVTLKLRIKPGTLTGLLQRAATVQTKAEPILVNLEIHVPEVAELKPQRLSWEQGEPKEPKKIRLTPKEGEWSVTKVRCTNANFKASTHSEEGSVVVEVQPDSTGQAMSSKLLLYTDSPYPAWKQISIPLEINASRDDAAENLLSP